MRINAVAVSAKNIKKSVEFYELLGCEFSAYKPEDSHVETKPVKGAVKLMIDSVKLMKSLIGADPTPANHSSFAIEYDSPDEVNEVAKKVGEAGGRIKKEPWDAFWGQRYAVVVDPDGYCVDLYAALS